MNASPIGVFDSGVGGLSLLFELRRLLPNEDFIYYGDPQASLSVVPETVFFIP